MKAVFALILCAMILTGCGGTGIQAPATVGQSAAVRPDRSGSWMAPQAKGEDLLYISNYSDVLVFSYPQGKLVGTLKGFYSAVGECVDSEGDVFITNFKPVTVYEYAHGGTKRIGSFPTKKAGNTGCAINPVNGDLAISGNTSYIEIYRGAKGKSVVLRDKHMFFGGFCTYDPSGDLFFAGYRRYPFDHYQLSELRAGGKTFINIKPDVRFEGEVSIQWNDKSLTAMSFVPWPTGTATIVRYAISGNRATKVGETPLDAPKRTVVQYAIDGNTVVLPNDDTQQVLFYKYPAGGDPFRTLTKKVTIPRGAVISPAQNR